MIKTRQRVAAVAAFLPLVFSLGSASFASTAKTPDLPSDPIPDSATISIKKLEQPDQFGEPATGLPQDINGTPIAGVTFTATLVPGIDLTDPSGWQELNSITVSDAVASTNSLTPADTATTNSRGVAQLGPLDTGLYLVQETSVPKGVLPSDPFLVTAPLPTAGTWLTDIHVYPKNAVASIDLRVIDEDTITSEDPVLWESYSTIPRVPSLDLYAVTNTLDPRLDLIEDVSEVRVQLAQTSEDRRQSITRGLLPVIGPSDYSISLQNVAGQLVIRVEFTPSGLVKLDQARADSSDTNVVISYRTLVRGAGTEADGVYSNRAYMRAGSGASTSDATTAEDTETTKFGSIQILARDRDHPQTVIPGTVFQLFATEGDAATLTNPIEVDGESKWTTGPDGSVTISGLRFSNFANGLDRDRTSSLFRGYYAVMTQTPSGWSGRAHVMAGAVEAVDAPVVLIQELWRGGNGGNGGNGGEGELPSTGADVAGAIVLGVGLLCVGFFLRTRRRESESEE
ncbi:SpaH/EbpB family LPXTG-anchored major pilin [Actinomycetaceae bacterium MB13-C1-2]|nr:SpaH/EbpB family LPXTG-anchored major pilin [Actinomycetaceae bacterium MB13-C1-2]